MSESNIKILSEYHKKAFTLQKDNRNFRKIIHLSLQALPYNCGNQQDYKECLTKSHIEALNLIISMSKDPYYTIKVHSVLAYASTEGSSTDNKELSLLRAKAIKYHLNFEKEKNNIDNQSLDLLLTHYEGRGEEALYAENNNEDHPLDRRAIIAFEINFHYPSTFSETKSNSWEISFQENISFFVEYGRGTLTKVLDNSQNEYKHFIYYAGSLGINGGIFGKVFGRIGSIANTELNSFIKTAANNKNLNKQVFEYLSTLIPKLMTDVSVSTNHSTAEPGKLYFDTKANFNEIGLGILCLITIRLGAITGGGEFVFVAILLPIINNGELEWEFSFTTIHGFDIGHGSYIPDLTLSVSLGTFYLIDID